MAGQPEIRRAAGRFGRPQISAPHAGTDTVLAVNRSWRSAVCPVPVGTGTPCHRCQSSCGDGHPASTARP
ncbi:Uncharacterised protein [Bordetella pertussis]|nr:Uncharacterised protein [Bordetella pertussis]